MSERDDIVMLAFKKGRETRVLDTKGKHHWNGLKLASDIYPNDDQLFEAFMQGWDAGAGLSFV